MTNLAKLSEMIQEANATLESLERAIVSDPNSAALSLTVRSLERSRRELESAFLVEAEKIGIEICSYRVFTEDGQPKAAVVGRALDAFQTAVSSAFASVRFGGPRASARLSADAVQNSSFDFGYSFPGSVGIVLTVPNERLLFGGSDLDRAIETVFAMAQADSPTAVAEFAAQVGAAPVRAMYRWAAVHASSGVGVDVQWRRDRTVRDSLFMELQEIDQLRATIEATSEASTIEVPLSGMLVGLQVERGTFVLAFEDGQHIQGTLSPDLASGLSLSNPLVIPARYSVWLTKTTRTQYSLDYDEETWVLDRLEPTSGSSSSDA